MLQNYAFDDLSQEITFPWRALRVLACMRSKHGEEETICQVK